MEQGVQPAARAGQLLVQPAMDLRQTFLADDVAADGEAVSSSGDAVRPCVGPVRARPPPRRLNEEEESPPVARRWSEQSFVRRAPRPLPQD